MLEVVLRAELTEVTRSVIPLAGRLMRKAIHPLNRRLEQTDIMMQVVRIMNAVEIINEIEALPEEEKGKVIDFVRHLDERSDKRTRFAGKDGFEKAAESVFSKHSKLFEKLAK